MSEHEFGPVVSSYTRAQAIQDGVLHDLSARLSSKQDESANVPPGALCCTHAVFVRFIEHDDASVKDQRERFLVANVWIAIQKAQTSDILSDSSAFVFSLHPSNFRSPIVNPEVELQVAVGLDDEGKSPVVTIMFPDED